MMTVTQKILLVAGLGSLVACNGHVNLDVSDAAVDNVSKVFVQFSSVSLKPASGDAVVETFNPPLVIDLLSLEDGSSARLLDNRRLNDGNYDSISLTLSADGSGNDSYVVLSDGSKQALTLAANALSGVTVGGGFSVARNGTRNLVIDFDLRKSLLAPLAGTSAYRLVPSLRLIDRDNSGTISGSFAGAGASGCTPAVYFYSGTNATLGDEGSATPPLTSARVRAQNTTPVTYTYTRAFLAPGSYTAAVTCNADDDDPEIADQAIGLQSATNVEVTAGATATVNF